MLLLNFVIMVVFVLVAVAFITLLERKILGYIQMRKGPNKVGVAGVIQPISDAVKLFSKESILSWGFNLSLYCVSPMILIILMLSNWIVYPSLMGSLDFSYGLLFFLCVLSMGVYVLLGCGWSSNSKFSLLGALRGVAQTVSYEVSLALVLLSLVMLVGSYSLKMFMSFQQVLMFSFINFPLVMIWAITILAETNRSPFDLSEGESELVSGFNVEFSSGLFAMLFMGEYGMIIYMSFLTSVLFFGNKMIVWLFFIFWVVFIIWMRAALPRLRYDKLMSLAWKIFLPVGLNYFMFSVGLALII